MQFHCEKVLLLNAILTASRAVASKSTIPALEGLLLQADETELIIAGYNMNTGIRTRLSAEITEPGALVLNARLLCDIVRRMPDDIITLSSDAGRNVHLTCLDASFYILALSADDYPELPEVENHCTARIHQSTLRAMIAETAYAISTDETKPVHTGSLFEISGDSVTVVSVDGFRLALRREKLSAPSADFSFVAPGNALGEVEKICEDVEDDAIIIQGDRHLLFEVGATQLICRRLEGEFLNYRATIPHANPITITAIKKNLMESIERVSVVIFDKQKSPVRCLFDDGKVLMSVKTANGEAKDICPINGDGRGLEIGFNNRYLLDALKYAPTDMVRLELNTGISPCIITPASGEETFLYMVLPVRLKNS